MNRNVAINRMLRYVGEIPIPSEVNIYTLPEQHEARTADVILREQNRELQEAKYWFNSINLVLNPDPKGRIIVPSNLISFENKAYFKEGGFIYKKDYSHKFDSSITLNAIIERDFEDLPDVFLSLVILVASKEIHLYLSGDTVIQRELERRIMDQKILLQQENTRQGSFNLLSGQRKITRDSNPS